jgi:hypothetical protein
MFNYFQVQKLKGLCTLLRKQSVFSFTFICFDK